MSVADSTLTMEGTMPMPQTGSAGNSGIQGNWPDVDVQVISDYRQAALGKPTARSAECVLRLHMDMQISAGEATKYAGYLAAGHHKTLYKELMMSHAGDHKKKGAKALRAALDLDDNGEPNP